MQHTTITPKQHHILRIVRGEDIVEQITSFCKDHGIQSGSLRGIGACDEAELGAYSVETKEYLKKVFSGEHEITVLIGIVSDTKVHLHATISDESFNAFGGHVNRMRVSATCEIHLISGEESISRAPDEETGLELLDF